MRKILLLAVIFMLGLFGTINAQNINPGYIDGHLYFKFNDDYNFKIKVNENTSIDFNQMPAEFTEMFERYGVTLITRPLYAFNDPKLERIIRLEFTDAQNISIFIKELELLEDVEYAEMVPYCTRKTTYNDPYYATLSQLNYKWHLEMINAPQAWGIQQGSSSVKVAIVDNAVWGAHPDLQISSSNMCSFANGTANPGNSAPPTSVSQTRTCSENDLYGTQYSDPNCPAYDWSHGTHCAGLVGAINNNGVGISSIGGGVTLMGVRAANNNEQMYYCMNGVTWAVNNGAKVVSMSFGSPESANSERTAYQSYYNNGVILVAAAGNEGEEDNSINYPGGYSSVISVASVNGNGKLSSFSQYGTGRADVAAPGGFGVVQGSTEYLPNILSTTYCTCQALRIAGVNNFTGEYYDGMQGTSMATPITAGLCGLLVSAYPEITPAQVKNCLISTGTALASGSHTIDNNVYINAYAAVQCAQSYSTSLVVNPNAVSLPSAGGNESVSVRAGTSSTQWNATLSTGANSWLTVSPSSGNGNGATTNVTITATSENGTGSPRTATITFRQGTETATVTVTQNDASDLCVVYNEDIMADDSTATTGLCSNLYLSTYFAQIAEKVTVTGTYSLDKITFADMLNTATSGTIAVKVWSATSAGLPNTELYSQNINISTINNALSQGQLQGGVTCRYGAYEHTLTSPITVTGPFFIGVDFTGVGAGNGNTMSNVVCIADNVNHGLENTAYINSTYSGYSGWKKVSSFFQGYNEAKFAIQAHICPIPYINVNPNNLSFAAAGEGKTFTISSNTQWTISCDADWITLNSNSGSENATITVTASNNTTTAQRTATITISSNNAESQTVAVTQYAHLFTVTPLTLSYTAAGGNKNITIGGNTTWSATSSESWLTLENATGSNSGTITAIAAANTSTSERTATITITGVGAEDKTVSVTQAGFVYTLTVNPTSLNYTAAGESKTVTITSNTTWSATSSENWLTISPASGNNNGSITAVAEANTSAQQRTATITISGENVESKTISVTQAGFSYTLTVNPSSLSYTAEGESKTVTVTSNTTWSATSSESWLTISPASGSNNGTITAVAEANTTNSQRTAIITVSGENVESKTISVTQEGATTSINEETIAGISVYPNPTKGSFAINFNAIEGNVTYQLVNAKGAIVETREINATDNAQMTFDYNIAAGVYFVRIISNGNTWTERIVVE